MQDIHRSRTPVVTSIVALALSTVFGATTADATATATASAAFHDVVISFSGTTTSGINGQSGTATAELKDHLVAFATDSHGGPPASALVSSAGVSGDASAPTYSSGDANALSTVSMNGQNLFGDGTSHTLFVFFASSNGTLTVSLPYSLSTSASTGVADEFAEGHSIVQLDLQAVSGNVTVGHVALTAPSTEFFDHPNSGSNNTSGTLDLTLPVTAGQEGLIALTAQSFAWTGKAPATCGNGVVETGEQCDDGNLNDGDGCSSTCQIEVPGNSPPDCSKAAASVSMLWPPNHKLVPVSVSDVTDPDGDAVTVTIDGIFQDEAVLLHGSGSGDTCPDASGVGSSTALLRSERDGTGDGRVYRISFTATDPGGLACTGQVAVCVPHDLGHGATCEDSGTTFTSTACQ